MRLNKLLLTSSVVFAVMFVSEFLIHGVALAGLYETTVKLWRPMAEMRSLGWLMWISYLIVSPVLVYIYDRGYEAGKPGLAQGIRFGFWMGLLQSAPMALNCYAVMPIPVSLAVGWFAGGMTEMLVIGAVIGMMWKK
jgi:hypothetical protein